MTRFSFQNGNVVIAEGYKISNALLNIPTLKDAAQIALAEIKSGKTNDCVLCKTIRNGKFKNIEFPNGAALTIPSDYNITSYSEALRIVIKEIN